MCADSSNQYQKKSPNRLKRTETDRNKLKQKKTERNKQNGQTRTEMDRNGQKRTETDYNGYKMTENGLKRKEGEKLTKLDRGMGGKEEDLCIEKKYLKKINGGQHKVYFERRRVLVIFHFWWVLCFWIFICRAIIKIHIFV